MRIPGIRWVGHSVPMRQNVLTVAVLMMGCGFGGFEPVAEDLLPVPLPSQPAIVPAAPVPLPPPVKKCVADTGFDSSRWECETVSALQIVGLKVTNTDGSEPWTHGQPRVITVMRNVTGAWLNYPSVQVVTSLQPGSLRESLYGMDGCGEAEMSVQFSAAAPKGTAITFTAMPAHINSDQCALAQPPVSVTVNAP